MLNLTAMAAETVRRLMSSACASAEPHAGVRISPGAGTPIAVTLVDKPEATDHTIEEEGATVFVEATTADFLHDKVLDACVGAAGVRFTIRDPAGAE